MCMLVMPGFKAELVLNQFKLWTTLFWPEPHRSDPNCWCGSALFCPRVVQVQWKLGRCWTSVNPVWTAEPLSTVPLLIHKLMKNTITVQVSCNSLGKFNRLSTLCCLSTVLYTCQSRHTEKGGNVHTSHFSTSWLASDCSFGILLLRLLQYALAKLGCTRTPQDNMIPTLLLTICQ